MALSEEMVKRIVSIVETAPGDENGKYAANVGALLLNEGINYKEMGYGSLKSLVEDMDSLVYSSVVVNENGPGVGYINISDEFHADSTNKPASATNAMSSQKYYNKNPLYQFAYVDPQKYSELASMALKEVWYYGNVQPTNRPYPILEQYLKYTYQKLNNENNVIFKKDDDEGEEYAAFNTGLVDSKYEYIYALFTKNRVPGYAPWFLLGFYVAGQDRGGKLLVKYFNPLPPRADYFGGDIKNMLYDSSSGKLVTDFEHIICERIGRFPKTFIEENISGVDTNIDEMSLDDAFSCTDKNKKDSYFNELGKRIGTNMRVMKRMKDRLQDAVNFAIKRVEWNYKTAIPMYYPRTGAGSLLLPLGLVDESKADLALVVEKQPSGSYQGHTVLTLEMAYSNSRLVTRPDSDWLQTNLISGDGEDTSE